MDAAPTYQLVIRLKRPITLQVGALGRFRFPAGEYRYTGSAKRNMEARLARHKRRDKPLRWHIDYLTSHPMATVTATKLFDEKECVVNQRTQGTIIAPGFGASDCRAGCGSHLKYMGL